MEWLLNHILKEALDVIEWNIGGAIVEWMEEEPSLPS